MGCHTWYRKPLVKGKENVQKHLRDEIDNQRKKDWWNEECENEVEMRLYAIEQLDEKMDEELFEYVNIEGRIHFIKGEPVVFVSYENDTDEPRIGGYPDTIITSADEMFKAMEKGLVGWKGDLFNFHIEEDRKEHIKKHIITFFEKYPDGMIEFG